jgi:serine/threonine protein kinase
MLAKLEHPFIIRHHKTYISANDTLSILMDYAANGTIHHLVRRPGTRLAENRIWKYAIQTILGLAYLFLDADDNIKIGDFGIARTLGDGTDLLRTIVGTPFYLSPGIPVPRHK